MRTPVRAMTGVALAGVAALTLSACSGTDSESSSAGGDTITVEDNFGEQEVPESPDSIVATDNTAFQTLDEWNVPLKAGAVALMPDTISYVDDPDIIDLGLHREPDLEAVVAVDPDLIINGNRYAQYREDFRDLAPDAAIVEVSPRDGEPLDEELKRGTTVLGEIFDKEAEADELISDFDESIERVEAAYNDDMKVMGVIVSGGQIGYVAPSVGRTIGPMFDIFGFTPALEVDDASDDHMGDDISVEAIADSDPDLIIVMDRDAGTSKSKEPDFTPAKSVIEDSAALQDVDAIEDDNVIYMPADTYTNESIQTYTEFFNSLADLLENNTGDDN